ncbi:uncharacterized protein MEPE_01487 [Melanopsichium pennsylvanicum]|uniref:Uncharacterized protein n=2 Tax=Melanopsichium pennsylvanicum TaxID=63383 RepID=A0AAJ4XJD6_9BASI|nr:conserved hypothetical protein [Melanopsichium pennsylvanicum 4]SNX82781.1 uncharacterized protein MEPE_01487 [Melanopsichium pennsylvanicum]
MTHPSAGQPSSSSSSSTSFTSTVPPSTNNLADITKPDEAPPSTTTNTTTALQQHPAPSTPPATSADLPTPPTSHNEFRFPPNLVASSSRLNPDEQLPHASPTTTVSENMGSRRAAARLSGGSASFDRTGDDSFSSQQRASRRSSIDRNDDRTVAAERPLHRGSYRSRATHSPSHSPGRSPTPSPILGPVFADHPLSLIADDHDDADDHDVLKLGHLSFPMLGVGVGPTKQEIETLVYGTTSANKDSTELASPADESGTIQDILGSLANMGLDPPTETSSSDRERELAAMVKMLASRCNTLTESRDRAQAHLKSTRLTALSVISSMKHAHTHALAAHRNLTDRLDAELDGWKAQGKMLSALLNRAEARGFDERRSNPTSTSVVTFAEKARAAAAASGGSPSNNRVASSNSESGGANPADTIQRLLSSPSFLASNNDSAVGLASPGTTGLGISSSGLAEVDADLSPTASLIRERNKLITDKKHLKARIRDAEAQVHKLESELKALRPYLVSGGIKAPDMLTSTSNAELQTPKGDLSQPGTASTTPSRSGSRKDKARKKRNITMGDAETEHLMLAARRLREMRKEQAAAAAATSGTSAESASLPASLETNKTTTNEAPNGQALAPASELHAPVSHAFPVKRQASEGPMTAEGEASYAHEPRTPPSRSAERPPKTPKSIASNSNTPHTGVRARELDELARGDDRRDSWSGRHRRLDSASSFTGIDELLQAAETLNPGPAAPSPTTRSRAHAPPFPPPTGDPTYYGREPSHRGMGYPPPLSVTTQRGPEYDSYGYSAGPYPIQSSPLRMAHESPKRRRVSSAAFDFEPYGSPFLGDRQPRIRTQTEGADPFMQSRPPPYHDYAPNGPPSAGGSQALSALDLLADQATASQNPSQGSDKSGEFEGVSPIGSLSSEDEMAMDGESRLKSTSRLTSSRNPDGSRSSKANGSQGSRSGESKSFGGNQNPEKRLPYVRWTAEEDTKLRAAIKEHGQRWELISRAVGTRSYHQCRQRYLLMRRKEAAAKAQADDGGTNVSASASDQQSQESDYGQDANPVSPGRRKTASHGRRGSRGGGDSFSTEGGVTSTPLHKLSIGAPAPPGSVYGQFSPSSRQDALPPHPSSQTPTHTRMHSHPIPGPLSPSMQPSSPFSSHTPSAVRRGHYPPPSPLSTSSRQLPLLQPPGPGYVSQGPPSSPHGGGHRRQFSGEQRPGSPTTPTSGGGARRMGATLYS